MQRYHDTRHVDGFGSDDDYNSDDGFGEGNSTRQPFTSALLGSSSARASTSPTVHEPLAEAEAFREEFNVQLQQFHEQATQFNEQSSLFYAQVSQFNEVQRKSLPNRNLLWTMLAISLIILIATAATFAALYAPQHMPSAISAIVNGLSVLSREGVLIGAAVAGTASLGATVYAANQLAKKPTLFSKITFNGLDELGELGDSASVFNAHGS